MAPIQATPTEVEKHLMMLAETPERIRAYIGDADDVHLAASPDAKTWSAVQVLAHLRACADLWGYTIYSMLAEKTPTFPLIDERRYAKTARYADLPFSASFDAFCLQRAELLAALRPLAIDQWERSGTQEGRSIDIFRQVRRMALHEVEHCDQIEMLLVSPNRN
jgi:hypothetical protein